MEVSTKDVLKILENEREDFNARLTEDQKDYFFHFNNVVRNAGVVLTIDKDITIPDKALEFSISKVLVQRHGQYSPDSEDKENGLTRFRKDYDTFIMKPCNKGQTDVAVAVKYFRSESMIDPNLTRIVKSKPVLNAFLQECRLCMQLYGKTDKLTVSSYNYMFHQ